MSEESGNFLCTCLYLCLCVYLLILTAPVWTLCVSTDANKSCHQQEYHCCNSRTKVQEAIGQVEPTEKVPMEADPRVLFVWTRNSSRCRLFGACVTEI